MMRDFYVLLTLQKLQLVLTNWIAIQQKTLKNSPNMVKNEVSQN